MLRATYLFLLLIFIFINPLQAKENSCFSPECIEFPKDAGVINVRDFGAKGDGVTDDTAAINAAIAASGDDTRAIFWQDKIVYFPSGTYLVSSPIHKLYKEGRYASGMVLMGQSRYKTIIKLADNAQDYQSADSPKAVIFTSAKLIDGNATSGGKDYIGKGEGNDAFNNFIENMAIDVGSGNPGAIGIDYLANNFGAIRNVLVTAGEDSGAIGISLKRKWTGPALINKVTVEGFDVGIDTSNTEYGITMENIKLDGQRSIGLRNDHNIISAHNLQVTGSLQPLINQSADGLIVVINGKLEGRNKDKPAFINNGSMNIRNLKANGEIIDGVYNQSERISASAQAWSLPVKQPPLPPKDSMKNWVAVHNPSSDGDATEAIRKAFNSGASTIYFPNGAYYISDNIMIPPSVQRILGMGSTIRSVKQRPPKFSRELGFFRSQSGGEPLTISHLAFDNSYLGDQVGVELSGKRTLILRDIIGAGVTTLKRTSTGGEAFLENTCCGTLEFSGYNGAWIKQLNTEGGGTRIINNGSPLWILGIKTEHNCTIVENKNGAITEVLGGLVYLVTPPDKPLPAFYNIDSKLLVSYAEESFNPKATYATHIRTSKAGVTSDITADMLPKRNIARMAPQLISQ